MEEDRKQLHVMGTVGVACRKVEQPEVRLHSRALASLHWQLLIIALSGVREKTEEERGGGV